MKRIVLTFSFLVLASFCQKKGLALKDAYIFVPPSGSNVTAAFLTIENPTNTDEILVKAETDIAEVVELHETYIEQDIAKMRAVEKLVVPQSGQLELKPGGYHIMLINLKRNLTVGEKIPLNLVFESGPKTVVAEVKERTHSHP